MRKTSGARPGQHCTNLNVALQVEQQLRQQLEVRMKALGRADQRFAHLEGVMRRLAHSAVPLPSS